MRWLFLSCALGVAGLGCGPTIGDPCTTTSECGAGLCLNRPFAPGGVCTIACTTSCPQGTTCINNVLGANQPGCMRTCQSARDCRTGYVCRAEQGNAQTICVGPEGI
jgi:hypothetical protein